MTLETSHSAQEEHVSAKGKFSVLCFVHWPTNMGDFWLRSLRAHYLSATIRSWDRDKRPDVKHVRCSVLASVDGSLLTFLLSCVLSGSLVTSLV